MVAFKYLTKVYVHIALDLVEGFPTHVTHLHATRARHFVAAIGFDKLLVAFRTRPHLGFAEGLLDLETSLVSAILLEDFLAPQWNVRGLATLPTRTKTAALDGTFENILHLGHLGLVPALWTHGQVLSQPGLFDLGPGLHFRIFLPCFGGQNFLQHLVWKSRVAPASFAAFDFQGWFLCFIVDS